MLIEIRRDCLKDLGKLVCTEGGVEITDTVRFLYCNDPAAQFEAGHNTVGPIAVLLVVQ